MKNKRFVQIIKSEFSINNYSIPYEFYDNRAKDTIIFVHGFNSSKRFIGNLPDERLNFNILIFSLPGSIDVITKDELRVSFLRDITSEVVSKVRRTRIHILGHSLGGPIALGQINNKKIKSFLFVSPYHPLTHQSAVSKQYESFLFPKNKLEQIKKNALIVGATVASKIKKVNLDSFINEESPWINIAKKDLFDKKFISELDNEYKVVMDKSSFLVSPEDKIISGKLLIKYLKQFDKDVTLVEGDHNPIKSNLDEVTKWLNANIKYRRRFFTKTTRVLKK